MVTHVKGCSQGASRIQQSSPKLEDLELSWTDVEWGKNGGTREEGGKEKGETILENGREVDRFHVLSSLMGSGWKIITS